MKKIRHDKTSIIGIPICYTLVTLLMSFIFKININYIIIFVVAVMAIIHTVIILGRYITYNDDDLIIYTMYIGNKKVKFNDIKYIKTERRTKSISDSIIIWVLTLTNNKIIKIKIDNYNSEDIKAFKNELNTRHKNIIIKTPEHIRLNQ